MAEPEFKARTAGSKFHLGTCTVPPSSSQNSFISKSSFPFWSRRAGTLTQFHIREKETNVICAHDEARQSMSIFSLSPLTISGRVLLSASNQPGNLKLRDAEICPGSPSQREGQSQDSEPGVSDPKACVPNPTPFRFLSRYIADTAVRNTVASAHTWIVGHARTHTHTPLSAPDVRRDSTLRLEGSWRKVSLSSALSENQTQRLREASVF